MTLLHRVKTKTPSKQRYAYRKAYKTTKLNFTPNYETFWPVMITRHDEGTYDCATVLPVKTWVIPCRFCHNIRTKKSVVALLFNRDGTAT
jgi:hypothetical protein